MFVLIYNKVKFKFASLKVNSYHVRILKVTSGLLMHCGQIPVITFVTKKGSQQMMNMPITVPRVLAAFVSLENLVLFFIVLPPPLTLV